MIQRRAGQAYNLSAKTAGRASFMPVRLVIDSPNTGS